MFDFFPYSFKFSEYVDFLASSKDYQWYQFCELLLWTYFSYILCDLIHYNSFLPFYFFPSGYPFFFFSRSNFKLAPHPLWCNLSNLWYLPYFLVLGEVSCFYIFPGLNVVSIIFSKHHKSLDKLKSARSVTQTLGSIPNSEANSI